MVAGAVLMVAASAGAFAALQNEPDPPASTGASAAAPGVQPTAGPGESAPIGSPAEPASEPAAQKSAALPTRISDVADRQELAGSWPAFTYTLQASTSSAAPLVFPGAINGFSLVDSQVSREVIEPGRYFAAVGELPVRTASYDQCREYRFYTRWMTVDPQARVESTFVDEAVRTVQNRPVEGSSGWQSSYGCVQPAMRITPSAEAGSAVVLVETQVWRRR